MNENSKTLTGKDMLYRLIHKFNGDWDKIFKSVQDRDLSITDFDAPIYNDVSFVSVLDSDYPSILKKVMPKLPFGFFYRGDLKLLDESLYNERVSILGTSKPTDRALNQSMHLASQFAKENKILVADLSKGISTQAIYSFIQNKGKVIVVLSSGFDNVYPADNKCMIDLVVSNGGLVITEFPGSCGASQNTIIRKNIVLGTLASEYTFIQARDKGTFPILISSALYSGADIYAVPDTNDPENYCNKLISDGAIPLFELAYEGVVIS